MAGLIGRFSSRWWYLLYRLDVSVYRWLVQHGLFRFIRLGIIDDFRYDFQKLSEYSRSGCDIHDFVFRLSQVERELWTRRNSAR